MKYLCCTAALLLAAALPLSVRAQFTVEGRVLDLQTRKPLVGVNVTVPGTHLGTTTGRTGAFRLRAARPVRTLAFSYVGYRAKTIEVAPGDTVLTVFLEPALLDLQPVVVSASRAAEQRTEVPKAIATLSARELETSKPNMLYQALNTLPGVYAVNLGNEQHTMSIRQPISYDALYLYLEDGIPLRPTGLFNHNALIEVNMAAVRRVEVLRGPSSVLYGSNAVGGAINFLTPHPTRRPSGALSLRLDSYGYLRADAEAGATFGPLGVWTGGYAARRHGGWSAHSDFGKLSLTLKANYALQPGTRLVTTLSTNHLDTDTNGSLDSLSFFEQDLTSLQTFTYRRVHATRLTSSLEHAWSDRHSTDVTLYYRKNAIGQLPHYRVRSFRDDPSRAWGEVNENSFWSLGFVAQHRIDFSRQDAELIAGVSLDRSPSRYVAQYLTIERDPETGRYVDYTRRDSLLTNYDVLLLNEAAYAQLTFLPVKRVRLVASLRYDRITYDYDNHLSPSAFSGAPDAVNTFNRFSPGLGLTYDLGGGSGLYVNYSRGFRPPEVGELYRGVKVPTLQPAAFDSYEVGGWTLLAKGRLRAEASVYWMVGKDEIISVELENGARVNRNAGKTRHVGVEYALTYRPMHAWSFRLSGTNARHTFLHYEEDGKQLDGNAMGRAPGWVAHAEAAYRPPLIDGARVALAWQHVAAYYMDAENTLRYEGHDLLGLRLGYRFGGFELWANVYNLTDALYATVASKSAWGQSYDLGPPRRVTVGVRYHFGGP